MFNPAEVSSHVHNARSAHAILYGASVGLFALAALLPRLLRLKSTVRIHYGIQTVATIIMFSELLAGTRKDKASYNKIRFCVDRAAEDGLQYSWVDTCCINKSTSDELSTAINSMFRWYQRASKCYVYLSDVQVPDEVIDAQAFRITWEEAFRRSRWFTRGWTLQELLAPATVEFFSKEGKRLGNRISLEREIHEITKIPIRVLRGQSLTKFSVEERMSWAAKHRTTLKEDKVYCLLGIFGVFLSPIYGEGEAYATLRLKEEIQKRQEGRGTEGLQDLTGTFLFRRSSILLYESLRS